jgi:hypothetical protein
MKNIFSAAILLTHTLALQFSIPQFSFSQNPLKIGKKETVAALPPAKTSNDIFSEAMVFEENGDVGKIDWTQQVIETSGSAILDTQTFKSMPLARDKAIQNALFEARGNLEMLVQGLYVEDNILLSELKKESEQINANLKKIIFQLPVYGEPKVEEGRLWLKVRLPLYQNGLGPILVEQVRHSSGPDWANLQKDGSEKGILKETGTSPTRLVLFVEGGFMPRLFQKILTPDGKIWLDFAQISGQGQKIPSIKRLELESVQTLRKRKSIISLTLVQNTEGHLQLDQDSYDKLLKWRALEKQFLGMIKGVYQY